MMKGWMIALLAILVVAASVYAAMQWMPGSSLPGREIEGVVDSIDMVSNPPLLSLRTEQGTEVISVDPQQTTVLVGGKPAPVGELVAGQRAKAIYRVKDGKEVASSIVVKSPPVSFPPASASTPAEQQ